MADKDKPKEELAEVAAPEVIKKPVGKEADIIATKVDFVSALTRLGMDKKEAQELAALLEPHRSTILSARPARAYAQVRQALIQTIKFDAVDIVLALRGDKKSK